MHGIVNPPLQAPHSSAIRETHLPLPVQSHRSRKPPLELRSNWDPWIPLSNAYPEVPRPLGIGALIVVSFVLLSLLTMVLVSAWLQF